MSVLQKSDYADFLIKMKKKFIFLFFLFYLKKKIAEKYDFTLEKINFILNMDIPKAYH